MSQALCPRHVAYGFAAGLCLIVSAMSSHAHGDTISQTKTHSLSKTNWTDSLQFDKFDPTLGTLTEVEISVTGQLDSNLSYSKPGGAAAAYTFDVTGSLNFGFLPVDLNSLNSFSLIHETRTVGAGQNGSIAGNALLPLTTESYLGSEMSPFIDGTRSAPDTFTVDALANGKFKVTGGSNINTTVKTMGALNVTVKYNFAPVPVPPAAYGGAALLGLVLLGKVAMGKRSLA